VRALLLAALLCLSPAALAADEPYVMGDLNASLVLPKGWEQLKWSDWELQAKSKDGMLFHLFKSDYQPDLTEANVAAHAEAYLVPLADQGFSEPTTTNASLTEIAGRPAGFVRTAVSVPKVGRGTAVTAIFAGKGITLHARVIAVAGQASKAEATLTAMLGLLQLSAEPSPTTNVVTSPSGLGATLPAGWRAPLPEELEAAQKVTALIGQPQVDLEKCWLGVRPPASGEADLLLTCKGGAAPGPIDSHSFAGVEEELHTRFFGKLTEAVPRGTPLELTDRQGVVFAVKGGKNPIRLLVLPYENNIATTWALSNHLSEEALDADLKAVASAMTFPGENKGAPRFGAGNWLDYYLAYRPLHPYVLVPGALILAAVAALVMKLRRVAQTG
jgi:hypothetical protein